jgi:uncharacterized protein
VIDAHSHLPVEAEGLATLPDLFGRIIAHYSPTTLLAAGFNHSREWLRDGSVPLSERWAAFAPYLDLIRESGYFRSACRTAKILFDIDDINEGTYAELSRRISAFSRPGYYSRILKDLCQIRAVINQGTWTDNKYAFTVYRGFMGLETGSPEVLTRAFQVCRHDGEMNGPEDFLDLWFSRCRQTGCLGIKMCSDFLTDPPDQAAAAAAFSALAENRLTPAGAVDLGIWMTDRLLKKCGKEGLVVAVHCGLVWTVGADFYQYHPKSAFLMSLRHPQTTFDLYHAGIPWVREIAVMANQSPNIFLNMTWAYQISPDMMTHALNEWLDLVPVNKIIGFGSDAVPVEKTAGALDLSRECIAEALAARLQNRGTSLTLTRAANLCRLFLYDNPARIYNLQQRLAPIQHR